MGPTNLDELLSMLPGARKLRSINASTLRWLLDRGQRECTWCGRPVGKGRSKWCGDECVAAFRERCDPAAQARLVAKRDGVTCSICGRDTKQSEVDGNNAVRIATKLHREATGMFSLPFDTISEIRSQYGYGMGAWSQVDHITPVSEGGGLLGIDNLRVLCGQCHARETMELKRRLRDRNQKS